jgi:translocation protein SEC63
MKDNLWCADDVARENYEKYGHPDGPQALNLGVALPEWLLKNDAKAAPFVLIALVFMGILLPLGVAACFLMSSNQYAGPNNVMRETLDIFLRCASTFSRGHRWVPML